MKKIICIGECSLNVVVDQSGKPLGSMPGGRVLNAAAILARDKFEVLMASDASADPVGDIVAGYLERSGVNISSVDRFTEGHTPLNVFVPSPDAPAELSVTRYEKYPDDCFDIVWPLVEKGDIVLFGGHYALDERMRQRLVRFLRYCQERDAVLVYLPGFMPVQEPRITRVMPALLENLEMANVVVARNIDLKLIFGIDNTDTAYHNHIDFYCRSLVSVDVACHRISYYTGKEMSSVDIPAGICRTMMWNSGAVAGVVASIMEQNLTPDDLEHPSVSAREAILGAAARQAALTAKDLDTSWQMI